MTISLPTGLAGPLVALALLGAANLGLAGEAAPAEPDGYRIGDYRSPVPRTLKGASVVDTPAAEALWRAGGAVFVDVLPRPPKPSGLPAGTVWRARPRLDIPGSVWLPDTGYGALSPETEDYLETGLAESTGGDRSRPLVVYCLRDCWMSWNAARRAVALGYGTVFWYPDGTDGWEEAGLPLEPAEPVPGRPR